jgi:hypothetical protein
MGQQVPILDGFVKSVSTPQMAKQPFKRNSFLSKKYGKSFLLKMASCHLLYSSGCRLARAGGKPILSHGGRLANGM